MAKPRKSWEPEYRFGGNPADYIRPAPLGESRAKFNLPRTKPKRAKKR